MGLGTRKMELCGFEEATKSSLLNFPIMGKREFAVHFPQKAVVKTEVLERILSAFNFSKKACCKINQNQQRRFFPIKNFPKKEGKYLYQDPRCIFIPSDWHFLCKQA